MIGIGARGVSLYTLCSSRRISPEKSELQSPGREAGGYNLSEGVSYKSIHPTLWTCGYCRHEALVSSATGCRIRNFDMKMLLFDGI